jgi:hypothetical protein
MENRLSPSFSPIHYNLELQIDLDEQKFKGTVHIDLNAKVFL